MSQDNHTPTVAVSIFGLLVLVGLVLRFGGLGNRPLDAAEAEAALSALALVEGRVPTSFADPLTVSATALSFFLFGANDFTARLAPAAAGTAAIGVCWWLRPSLGYAGATATSAVIALSPTAIYFSRHLSDGAFGLLLGVVVAVLAPRWVGGRLSPRRLVPVGLGLALAGGAAAFTVLAATAIGIAGSSRGRAWPKRRDLVAGAAVVGAALAALTTAGFLYPQGLGLHGLEAWLQWFDLRGVPALPTVLLLLVGYEPVALLFGLGSLWVAARRRAVSAVQGFALAWLGVGLVAAIFSMGQSPIALLSVVAPLWLLAGDAIGKLIRAASERPPVDRRWWLLLPAWPVTALVGLGTSWLALPGTASADYRWLGLGFIALVALAVAGVALVRDGTAVLGVGLLLPLSLAFELHSALWLNQRPSPHEMFVGRSAVSEAAAIAARVARLAPAGSGILVDEALRYPMAWYFRDLPAVTFGAVVAGPALVLAKDASLGAAYSSRTATLSAHWLPTWFDAAGLWRWLLYREAYGPVSRDRFSIYLRR